MAGGIPLWFPPLRDAPGAGEPPAGTMTA